MRVKDNWEYVQDFCNDFGRLPKDADELEYFLSYVDEKRQKAGRDITKMMETPVSEDLEEAAEISFDEANTLTEDYLNFLAKGLKENHPRPIGPHWFCEYAKNRFIAGAKWQAEKDARDMYMSDNRHFEKVYQLGRTDMREQMMNEAVEGEITNAGGEFGYDVASFRFDENHTYIVLLPHEEGRKHGDKVRIIIVKEKGK